VIYLILSISGFSSLYYEFLALKQSEIHLGISTFAVSSILLTFLTGIFIGNLLAGRLIKNYSDRKLKNLLIAIEILIIPIALSTPWLIKLTGQLYLNHVTMDWPLTLRLSIRYLLVLPALLPLSILTGVRFPLYLKLFNRRDQIGFLYGFSCLGSAIGALAGGFFIFEYLGVYNSLISIIVIAAPANIILLILWSKSEISDTKPLTSAIDKSGFKKPIMAILLLFFILGLATIGLEILWVRSLIRNFPNHRYIFSTITSVLLVSLFIGSLSSRFIKPGKNAIIFSFLALGVSCQLGLGLQEKFNFFKLFGHAENLSIFVLNTTTATAIIIAIPCLVLGLLFPLLFNYALKNSYIDKARLTALSISVNSAGAICGALLFGFLLMQLSGYKILLTALSGTFLIIPLFVILKKYSILKSVIYGCGLLLFAGSTWLFFADQPLKDYYLLTTMTGADADVRIYERKNFDTPNRILTLNQAFISGGSGYLAERTQRKQSLIPLLLAQQPERALTISLATGITASVFAEAGIKQVECIELLPSSIKLSDYFKRENGNILERDNFNLIIGDGRLFIQRANAQYDIILSDNYQYSSSATPMMYTVETFQSIKQAMSEHGVFIQWLPIKQIPPEHLKIIINTFRQVFPDGELYFNDISRTSSLLGLVAYKNNQPTYLQIADNYQKQQQLCKKSLFNNHTLFTYYIGTAKQFNDLYPTQAVNSHEHPVLEKYFMQQPFNRVNFANLEVLYKQNSFNSQVPFQDANANTVRRKLFIEVEAVLAEQHNKNYLNAFNQLNRILQRENINNQSINTFFPEISFLKGELAVELAVQYFTARNVSYANGYLNIAATTLFRNTRFFRIQGILFGIAGNLTAAEQAFANAIKAEPRNLRVHESKALTYLHYGQNKQALAEIKLALDSPYSDLVILRSALIIYMKLDRYEQFLQILNQYLALSSGKSAIIPRAINYLKKKKNTAMVKKLENLAAPPK
jgi:spermidine synthase